MKLTNTNNCTKPLIRGMLLAIAVIGLTVALIKYMPAESEELESTGSSEQTAASPAGSEVTVVNKDPDSSQFEGIGLEDPDARRAFMGRPKSERDQIKKLTRIYLGNKEDSDNNVVEPSNEEKAAAFITVQKKFFYKDKATIAGYFSKKIRQNPPSEKKISINDIDHVPFSVSKDKLNKTSVEVLIIEQCGYQVAELD